MRALRFAICCSLGLVPVASLAQPLPSKLSGEWVVVVPGGPVFRDTLSVAFDPRDGYGPITGRLTTRGVACGSQDEPLTGTWDGKELRFESMVRPGVNSQRTPKDCGSGKVLMVLKPVGDKGAFEGESRRPENAVPAQVKLAP